MATAIVGAVVILAVVFITRSMINDRKNGGCTGSCGQCGGCRTAGRDKR